MTVTRTARSSFCVGASSTFRSWISCPRGRRYDVLAIATAAIVNERYFDRRFTIAGLARELHVLGIALRLRFRQFYNLTLDEHPASRRLELATTLMSRTPHRLGALESVARSSGYRSTVELDRDSRRYRHTPALAAWFRMSSSRGHGLTNTDQSR